MNKEMKNAKIYLYAGAILQFQGFIGPILFVFYTSYMGLNTTEYLVSDALLFIIMSFCEIPSGIIADSMGRKKALIISQLMICIGMIILLISHSFAGAMIVAIIYGVFGALQSGTAESIFYELYETNNALEEYEYISSKVSSVGFVISIIYAVCSGHIAKINAMVPLLLDLLISFVLVALSFLLITDKKEYRKRSLSTLPQKAEIKNVMNVMLVTIILLSSSRVLFSFYQPILLSVKMPVEFLGYASALYSIVAAVSAYMYKQIRKRMSEWNIYVLIIIMQIIATFGMAFVDNRLVVLFILIQQVQRGIAGTFSYMQVNQYIESKRGNRVSIMSMMYFGISILTGLSLGITSYASDKVNLKMAIIGYVVVLNLVLIISYLTFYLRRTTLKKYIEE